MDISSVVSAIQRDGASGALQAAALVVPDLQNDVLTLYKNMYQIKEALTASEFESFKRYAGHNNLKLLPTATHRGAHLFLRSVSNYLLDMLFRIKVLPQHTPIIVMCSTFKEAVTFTKRKYQCIFLIRESAGKRDSERLRLGAVEANEVVGEYNAGRGSRRIYRLAREYLRLTPQRRSSGRFVLYNDINDIPRVLKAPIAVNIDGIYDFSPHDTEKALKRWGVVALFATFHPCAELFLTGVDDAPVINNQILGFSWAWYKKSGYVEMIMDDDSSSYIHNAEIVQAWNKNSNPGNFHFDKKYSAFGYGLYQFGFLDPHVPREYTISSGLDGCIRLPFVRQYINDQTMAYIFVEEENWNSFVNYVSQLATDPKKEFSFANPMLWLRSHGRRIEVIGKLVSHGVNLMDVSPLDIIICAFFEVSLRRQDMKAFYTAMPLILKNTFEKQEETWMQWFGKLSLRYVWDAILSSFSSLQQDETFVTHFRNCQQYKIHKPSAKTVVHAVKDQVAQLRVELRDFSRYFVGGKAVNSDLEKFKEEVLGYTAITGDGLGHGGHKVRGMEKEFLGKSYIHIGAEPGTMIPELARICRDVEVFSFSETESPLFLGMDPNKPWKLFSNSCEVPQFKFNRKYLTSFENVTYKNEKSVVTFLSRHHNKTIFSDVSCCNGSQCANAPDATRCPRVFNWFDAYCFSAFAYDNVIIFKINTPDMTFLQKKLNFWKWRVVFRNVTGNWNRNPMSFELYLEVRRSSLVTMWKANIALETIPSVVEAVRNWDIFDRWVAGVEDKELEEDSDSDDDGDHAEKEDDSDDSKEQNSASEGESDEESGGESESERSNGTASDDEDVEDNAEFDAFESWEDEEGEVVMPILIKPEDVASAQIPPPVVDVIDEAKKMRDALAQAKIPAPILYDDDIQEVDHISLAEAYKRDSSKPVAKGITYGIACANFPFSKLKSTSLWNSMDSPLPCEIVADGLCFFRAVCTVFYEKQEGFKAFRLSTPQLRDIKLGNVPLQTAISVAKSMRIPYFQVLGSEATCWTPRNAGKVKTRGALLFTHNHVDVVMYCGPKKSHLFQQTYIVRPFQPAKIEKMKTSVMRLSELYKGITADVIIDDFLEMLQKSETVEFQADHRERAALTFEKVRNSKITDLKYKVLHGPPGTCKTDGVMDFEAAQLRLGDFGAELKRTTPGQVVFLAPSAAMREEVAARWKGRTKQNEKFATLMAKTFVAIFVNSKKPSSFRIPNVTTTRVIIDEAMLWPMDLIVLIHLVYPQAEFLFLGDMEQLDLDLGMLSEKQKEFGAERQSLVKYFSSTKAHKRESWHEMKVTRRGGPTFVQLLRNVKPHVEVYCDNVRPLEIHLHKHLTEQLSKPEDGRVFIAPVKEYCLAKPGKFFLTVKQAQGVSKEKALVCLEGENLKALANFPTTAYVAFSRAKSRLDVVLPEGEVLSNKVRRWLTVTDKVNGLRMGGPEHFRQVDLNNRPLIREMAVDLHEYMTLHPTTLQPTLKTHETMKKLAANPVTTFERADLEFLQHLPEGNTIEQMVSNPKELGTVRLTTETHIGKTTTAELMFETSFGNRHYVSSQNQNNQTVVNRVGVSEKIRANKKLRNFNFQFHQYERLFRETLMNMEDYDKIMNESVFEYFTSAAVNDFKEVMKFSIRDEELTMRKLMEVFTEHLKTQCKAKGLESTLKDKAGQPIIAAEKAINLCYGPIFRTIKRLVLMLLKDHVIFASGATPQELGKKWNIIAQFILEFDMPEFDAEQDRESAEGEFLIFQMFNPFGDSLRDFYSYRGPMLVFGPNLRFVVTAKSSGLPDTFDGNTIHTLWIVFLSVIRGPLGARGFQYIKRIIVGGDDSGIACEIHPKCIFDFSWLNGVMYEPIKTNVVETGVLEFSNWLFYGDICVYNPLVCINKIVSKNLTQVLRDRRSWNEWMDSFAYNLQSVRSNYWDCVAIVATRFGYATEFAERLLNIVESYTRIPFEKARQILQPSELSLEDFVVGGGVFIEDTTKNMEGKRQEIARKLGLMPADVDDCEHGKCYRDRCYPWMTTAFAQDVCHGMYVTFNLWREYLDDQPWICCVGGSENLTDSCECCGLSPRGHVTNLFKLTDDSVVPIFGKTVEEIVAEIQKNGFATEINSFENEDYEILYRALLETKNTYKVFLDRSSEPLHADAGCMWLSRDVAGLKRKKFDWLNNGSRKKTDSVPGTLYYWVHKQDASYKRRAYLSEDNAPFRIIHLFREESKNKPIEAIVIQEKEVERFEVLGDVILFENHVGAWVCCECESYNSDGHVCLNCGQNVSNHYTRIMVTRNGETIPRFGQVHSKEKKKTVEVKLVHKHPVAQKKKPQKKKVSRRKLIRIENGVPTAAQRHGPAAAVLNSIVNPERSTPVRFRDEISEEQTAALRLINQVPLEARFAGDTQTNNLLEEGIALAIQSYSYTCNTKIIRPNRDALNYGYIAQYSPGCIAAMTGADYKTVTPTQSVNLTPACDVPCDLRFSYMTWDPVTTWAPHGQMLCMGSNGPSDDRTWFPMTDEDSFTLQLSGSSFSVTFAIFMWTPTGVINIATTNAFTTAGNKLIYTAVENFGYYSIQLISLTGTPTIVTGGIYGNSSVVAHMPVFEFYKHGGSFDEARVLSGSTRACNGAAQLNKQGFGAGLPLAAHFDWQQLLSMPWEQFSSQIKAKTITFYKGLYTYLKPSELHDFEFVEEHKCFNGQLVWTGFPLSDPRPTTAVMIKIDSALGVDALWINAAHLEFVTVDSWYSISVPQITTAAWSAAFSATRSLGTVFENESHWKTITAWLKNAVPWVVKNVPRLIETYGPMVADAAAAL